MLEMKNRPLNMRKTMAELDEALGNRDALAAIAVFRSQEQAPTVGAVRALRRQGDRGARPRRRGRLRAAPRLHVGALDGAQGPRGRARRRRSTSSGCAACSTTPPAPLERHTAIKRFHTQAKKSIDQAADQVCDLVQRGARDASTPSTPSSAPERALHVWRRDHEPGAGLRRQMGRGQVTPRSGPGHAPVTPRSRRSRGCGAGGAGSRRRGRCGSGSARVGSTPGRGAGRRPARRTPDR